jgi:hypothetical protein
MEAEKNIFGQYKQYVPVILTDEEKVVVKQVVNVIGDQIQAQLTDAEFIAEVSKIQPTVQFLVGAVNENLPEGVTKVDGYALTPIVKEVIAERLALIAAKEGE